MKYMPILRILSFNSFKIITLILFSSAAFIMLDETMALKQIAQASYIKSGKNNILEYIGTGYVTDIEPNPLPPLKNNLSRTEQIENFDIFCKAIDRYYSFFIIKNIDWNSVTAKYCQRIKETKNSDEFYSLLRQIARELKDSHFRFCNYPNSFLPTCSPELTIRKIEDMAVVSDVPVRSQAYAKGIRRGSIITEVDELPIKVKIEQNRPLMIMFSSEQAFQEYAYRYLLNGAQNTKVTIKYIAPDNKSIKTATLTRVIYKPRDIFVQQIRLQKRKYVWFGIDKSGYGYIRILSFKGREEIAEEFDQALEKLKECSGLIIDVRDNPGGGSASHKGIIGRLLTNRIKVNIAYVKKGVDHNDFKSYESYFGPTGPWQYNKPVVLLINSITGSAADLFVSRLISAGRVITIGSPTHGDLPGEHIYAVLPCGLVMQISTGYVCDIYGKIIEGNGNSPDICANSTIQDIIKGRDAVFERAIKELDRLCGKK